LKPRQQLAASGYVRLKTLLLEALVVGLVGALLAFGANGVSNRGLSLRRDYFDTRIQEAGGTQPGPGQTTTGTHDLSPLEQLVAQGIRLADSNQVASLFHDPRLEQGLVAFIDARDDEHYQSGHIPGAWQFDQVHPENYLATVLPVCKLAQEVVVYCNGGACEDSVFAARFLASSGVPKEKLSIYAGGITEWSTNRMPVEVGQRNSGRLTPAQGGSR
jgi:rhodanese-related sulfurtransferase